jgi:hypothetical protein
MACQPQEKQENKKTDQANLVDLFVLMNMSKYCGC